MKINRILHDSLSAWEVICLPTTAAATGDSGGASSSQRGDGEPIRKIDRCGRQEIKFLQPRRWEQWRTMTFFYLKGKRLT